MDTSAPTLSITAAQVRQTVQRLVQHLVTTGTPLINQRNEVRHAVSGPAFLGVRLGEGDRFRPLYRAWATDISDWGIGLLTEGELPLGMELHVNLAALTTWRPCILPVRVAYCQQLLVSAYRVGGAFLMEPLLNEPENVPCTD